MEHRHSIILIGIVISAACLFALLFVEIYVRGTLGLRYLEIKKLKISPSLFILLLLVCAIIFTLNDVRKIDKDIAEETYEIYIGECVHKERTVYLKGNGIKMRADNGDIVPYGNNYGKCIYSKRSRLVVDWESIEKPDSLN